jgi:molybdopterin molybdotransferase
MRFDNPAAALEALLRELATVPGERVALSAAAGRVLAEPVAMDRDSPPCDTSAMDGYAVRLADLTSSALAVAGEIAIGVEPPAMPAGAALRIVTGAPVPSGADAVIRREDMDEADRSRIVLRIAVADVKRGENIRQRGENGRAGSQVVPSGKVMTPAAVAALAAFGAAGLSVSRFVRIGILNSGDELLDPADSPRPWQIRDSNGPALEALVRGIGWCSLMQRQKVADDAESLRRALAAQLDTCDIVLTTGGVSAGDHDYVPQVVRDCGGRIIFHKLPVRPGKPVLGAVCGNKAIIGLPGNPVSALVCARRLVVPILRRLAGATPIDPPAPKVMIDQPDEATLKLWWWRLVRLSPAGQAALVPNRGSGDLVALAASDGFVEIPPGASGGGPWPLYRWEV